MQLTLWGKYLHVPGTNEETFGGEQIEYTIPIIVLPGDTMRIIHIAGRSGSGKTTFIRELCPALLRYGRVGTIKHLGHHSFTLTPGKDTTLHYETGAYATAGIDDEKSVISIRTADLSGSLRILSDIGVDYLVIEGFKAYSFTKILIGEMEGEPLLRNPTVDEVISHLDEFDEFFSLQGLIKALNRDNTPPHPVLSYTAQIRYQGDPAESLVRIRDIQESIGYWPGISGVRIHIQKPFDDENGDQLLITMAGTDFISLGAAFQWTCEHVFRSAAISVRNA